MRKALASLATDHLLEQRWVACAHGCRQLAATGLELYGRCHIVDRATRCTTCKSYHLAYGLETAGRWWPHAWQLRTYACVSMTVASKSFLDIQFGSGDLGTPPFEASPCLTVTPSRTACQRARKPRQKSGPDTRAP